jgi:hypothetical protein
VFPNADYLPTSSTECLVCLTIPFLVCRELFFPILFVAAGGPVAARAAVPKASINENRNALVTEDEIRPAWQVRVATPSFQPKFAKQSDHSHFGRLIAEFANTRHVA